MARSRIIDSGTGPEVQWGNGPSFAFERGDDDSLLVALTKAVNVGVEAGDQIEGGIEQVIAGVIQKAAGDLAWPPGEGFAELREAVQAQLPKNANGYSDYSVHDVSRDGKRALVCSWTEGDNKFWIVPLTLHGSGGEEVVVVPALSEWVEVEQEYVVAKAGRVLSAKNLRLVQEAAAALAALAEAARREEAAPTPEEATTKAADEDWDGVEYLVLKEKKKDKDMRYTYGPLYAPARKDAHGEWVEAGTLHKALIDFVRESADAGREIHLQHGDVGDVVAGEWVEVTHWPYEHTIVTKSADGVEHEVEMPEGTVYMGVVWGEDYWDEEAGRPKGIDGLSLGGRAVKVTGGDATMKSMGWKDGSTTKKEASAMMIEGEPEDDPLRLGIRALIAETERDALRKEAETTRMDRVLTKLLDVFKETAGSTRTIGDTHVHLPEQNVSITQGDGLEKILEPEPKE